MRKSQLVGGRPSTRHNGGEFGTTDHNRPLPSSLVPLFQNESKCETILKKRTLICMKMKLHAELIFIKVSHLQLYTCFETEAQEDSEMVYWSFVAVKFHCRVLSIVS